MDNTSAEDQETIREFLVESHENLSRLGERTPPHQKPCKANQPSKQTFPSSSPLHANENRDAWGCWTVRVLQPDSVARRLQRLRLYVQRARVGAGWELGLTCQIDLQVQIVGPVRGSIGR
jgi:hypothetical protein